MPPASLKPGGESVRGRRKSGLPAASPERSGVLVTIATRRPVSIETHEALVDMARHAAAWLAEPADD